MQLPLGLGGIVIPTAHVAPTSAAGTVQFKDGATNIGAPARVTPSAIVGPVSTLGRGQHSLTAVPSGRP